MNAWVALIPVGRPGAAVGPDALRGRVPRLTRHTAVASDSADLGMRLAPAAGWWCPRGWRWRGGGGGLAVAARFPALAGGEPARETAGYRPFLEPAPANPDGPARSRRRLLTRTPVPDSPPVLR